MSVRRRRRRPPETSLALSFIDTISGGFGAAFFMFLIFASLPLDTPTASGGATRFMEIWLTWTSADELAEITLDYGGGRKIVRMSAENAPDPLTGAISVSGAPWKEAHSNGFSWFGDRGMAGTQTDGTGQYGTRLRLADPCPGEWRVTLSLHSRREGESWFTENVPVEVAASAILFDGVKDVRRFSEVVEIVAGQRSPIVWQEEGAEGTTPVIGIGRPYRSESLISCGT